MSEGHSEHIRSAQLLAGKTNGRHVKVVMLGAGSAFTQRLVTDVLSIPALAGGEVALVDIDAQRLALARQVIKKVIAVMGKEETWHVTATEERREALVGADYTVNCIEVSGTEAVRFDNDIPLKY